MNPNNQLEYDLIWMLSKEIQASIDKEILAALIPKTKITFPGFTSSI